VCVRVCVCVYVFVCVCACVCVQRQARAEEEAATKTLRTELSALRAAEKGGYVALPPSSFLLPSFPPSSFPPTLLPSFLLPPCVRIDICVYMYIRTCMCVWAGRTLMKSYNGSGWKVTRKAWWRVCIYICMCYVRGGEECVYVCYVWVCVYICYVRGGEGCVWVWV